MSKDNTLKCVVIQDPNIKNDRHILIPGGFTLCGIATVDVDPETIPVNFRDILNEYIEVEWNIDCEKCIHITNHIEAYTAENN